MAGCKGFPEGVVKERISSGDAEPLDSVESPLMKGNWSVLFSLLQAHSSQFRRGLRHDVKSMWLKMGPVHQMT